MPNEGQAWGEKNGVKTRLLCPLKFPPKYCPVYCSSEGTTSIIAHSVAPIGANYGKDRGSNITSRASDGLIFFLA